MEMMIVRGFGLHKHQVGYTFMTSIHYGRNTITKYSAAPLTPRQYRKLKRESRSFIASGLKPHEHKMFQCSGCKKCKGA